MAFCPMRDYVLVLPEEQGEKMEGGVLLPEPKEVVGIVASAGPKTRDVGVGDKVVLPVGFKGTPVFIGRVRHYLLRERDLLAVIG